MNRTERILHARRLFLDSADLGPDGRDAAVALASRTDPDLGNEVRRLFDAHDSAGGFLDARGALLELPAAEHDPGERSGQAIDRYTLVERLGEGGFGTVWLAEQTAPVRRSVALKIIKLGMDTRQVIARFGAERQALAMMDHPAIARVYDAGATDTGRPYFVMELVRGVPIISYCNERGLGTQARLELFVAVCRAVQHAHQKGVIHRDLKPANILITDGDTGPAPKIIDFGIAKATGAEPGEHTLMTGQLQMIGTPAYMAPEQADPGAGGIDTRADIYALGVLLYELLTGVTPFDLRAMTGPGLAEMLRTIRQTEPPRPSARIADDPRRAAELRDDLDWITMKCLEKDRDRRYESAGALADDVARSLRNEPVLAGPPTAAYRARKFVRRHRAGVAAACVGVALLSLGAGGTAYGLVAALREQEKARDAEARAERRAAELASVSSFQASQLGAIDPLAMAAGIRDDLIAQARAADPSGTDAALSSSEDGNSDFERTLHTINFTTLALRSLDEHVFSQTLRAIDARFADQPIVRADLLFNLGVTMHTLGLLQRAEGPLRQALDIRLEHLGPDHPDTLAAKHALGVWLIDARSFTEAEPLIEDALQGRTAVFGLEHPLTLETMTAQLDIIKALNPRKAYLEQMNQLLDIAQRLDDADRPAALAAIAQVYLRNVGFIRPSTITLETESEYTRLYESCARNLGHSHPATIDAREALASLLDRMKRPADALSHYQQLYEICRESLGDEHPRTLHMLDRFAVATTLLGMTGQADPLFREILRLRRRVLGDAHPDTLSAFSDLARNLELLGRDAEASDLLAESIEIQRRTTDPNHQRLAAYTLWLGKVLNRQNRHAETIERLTPLTRPENGANPLQQAKAFELIAAALAADTAPPTGFPAAEAALLEAWHLRTAHAEPNAPPTLRCAAALADLYRAWHDHTPTDELQRMHAEWDARARTD
jgi:tetratricopeptide (TPR) repeat protein